jgi:hypothetical protein
MRGIKPSVASVAAVSSVESLASATSYLGGGERAKTASRVSARSLKIWVSDVCLSPKFCAKIAGVKTIQIALNLAYFLRFEVLEKEGCQHDQATRSISHAP